MSRITRERWIQAGYGLLAEGLVPADVPLRELWERLGVTKGSFYAHFRASGDQPGGVAQLYAEIVARWAEDIGGESLTDMMTTVRSPLERLRLLRAWALKSAVRDGSMRRWADRDPVVAAAVRDADTAVTGHVTQALRDMGFTESDAAVLAAVLVSAFVGAYHTAASAPRPDPARFEALLGILIRSAATEFAAPPGDVATAPGADDDRAVLFRVAPQLPPAAIRQLAHQATRFARDQAAQQDDPPGDRAGAGPARTSEVTGT
jgi:AcrR family transcriptional regulator